MEWRNGFGSAAISVVITFFEDEQNRHKYATDEYRKAFAADQLKNYKFMYKTTISGGDERVCVFRYLALVLMPL